MASIQFSKGVTETVIPDVKITRSKDGTNGTATFYFEQPDALSPDSDIEITGMYLQDDEGELVTKEVKAKFVNGQPEALEALYVMKSAADFERFIRFMERYASENGLTKG
jgi:photosystem II 13kDa protein